MAWVIDKDHIADADARPGTCRNAVGLMGPRGYKGDGSELTHRFRILDDDGEVYYEGRCDTCDDDNALEPLDNFGTPNAGATTIQYWDHGWKNLN